MASLTDVCVGTAIGGQLGGLGINYTYLQNQLMQSTGTSLQTQGMWNLGYSPSTNTMQYYQTQQPQNRNTPILERLRSEIKEWHGEVLKV